MICQKEYTEGPELWLASETQHPTRAAGQGAGRPQVRWLSPYQSISARQSVLLVSASPSARTHKSGQSSDYLGVKETGSGLTWPWPDAGTVGLGPLAGGQLVPSQRRAQAHNTSNASFCPDDSSTDGRSGTASVCLSLRSDSICCMYLVIVIGLALYLCLQLVLISA